MSLLFLSDQTHALSVCHDLQYLGLIEKKEKLIELDLLLEMIKTEDLSDDDAETWTIFFGDGFRNQFIKFLHDIVACMIDKRKIMKHMVKGDKTIVDLLHHSDMALAVLMYAGHLTKWTEIKQHEKDPDHPSQKNVNRGGKYNDKRARGRYAIGYNVEGMDLYEYAKQFFAGAKSHKYWFALEKDCRAYFNNSETMKAARRMGEYKGKSGKDAIDNCTARPVAPRFEAFAKMFYSQEDPSKLVDNSESEDDEDGEASAMEGIEYDHDGSIHDGGFDDGDDDEQMSLPHESEEEDEYGDD